MVRALGPRRVTLGRAGIANSLLTLIMAVAAPDEDGSF